MIKVVGVDPGLAATGIAVVRGLGLSVERYSYGIIKTSARSKLQDRLNHIYTKLSSVLSSESPNLIVVEDIFSLEKYPKSGIALGKVTGVILLAGCRLGIPVMEISVREAKRVLTGSGAAGKKQLEESVRKRLNHPLPIKPYHASDALALAMIGLFRGENAFSSFKRS
jgi:crossover junction endodeoxyribonuclease RuvC